MRVTPIQNAFNAGEFSPRMSSRQDFGKYGMAGEVVTNFIMLPQGGMMRRPGTRYIAPVKAGGGSVRLIPFVFSDVQAYILEFGDGYIRFFKDKGQIISGETAYEIVSPYASADVFNIAYAQSADVLYLACPGYAVRKLSRTGHTSWTIEAVVFEDGPYIENATTTTLTASGINGTVTITASSTTGINKGQGFLASDVGRHIRIYEGWAIIASRVSSTQVTATVQTKDGYATLLPTYTATTISFKEDDPDNTGQTHNDSILDSAAMFLERNFKVDQRIIATGTASNNNNFTIVYVDRGQIKTAVANDVVDESPGASVTLSGVPEATKNWGMGAWSATTGYPRAVTFHEQRLWFGGTTEQPQSFWGSVSADFENFGPGTDDDDAITWTIASGDVNVIRWLASAGELLIGTAGGEFTADSGGDVLTPTNLPRVRRATTYGSEPGIRPVQVGNVVLFAQRAGRVLREFVFSNDQQAFVAPDLTILAEHITRSGIKDMAYQESADSVIWCALQNGKIATSTYRRDQDVVGWARQIVGGVYGNNDAVVETVAVIPGTGDYDEVWVVVSRDINGATARYVEVFEDPFIGPSRDDYDTLSDWRDAVREAQKDAWYLDTALAYDGAAVTTITGLDHLEGETVSALADGYVHPPVTVSGGEITLRWAASKVLVGLPYMSRFKSLRVVGQAESGSSLGAKKKLSKFTLALIDACEFYVGTDWERGVLSENRYVEMTAGDAVPVFTGDKTIAINSATVDDPRVHVWTDQPLPMTVSAISFDVSVSRL